MKKKWKLKKLSTIASETKEKVKKNTKKMKKKAGKNWILTILMAGGIGIASLIILFGIYIVISAPAFTTNKLYSKEASVLYDKDGNEITRLGSENRVLVTYDDLPQVLIDALVATEDSRFFQHNGFDAARFLKASMYQALGKDAGGASTLTMQVAKNTYSTKDTRGIKGIVRKFTDIYMSIFKIEKSYTKEEIIEFYVNSQWLGSGKTNNYANINGVEQGSQAFFGKSVKDLSLPEASLLVGIFNNPYKFSPIQFPENAKKRQKTVLNLMVRHGYITEEEASVAAEISIESLLKTNTTVQSAGDKGTQAFIDYVVKDVKEKTGDDPSQVPMAIYTTMDRNIQDVVTQLENGELYKFPKEKLQNGMAITSTQDGSILALGAGRNYVYQSTNRALNRFQPGSTIKPILDYGPLIEYNNASTGEVFIDEPYTYTNGGSIKNYDGKYVGLITMKDALVDSRNIPALQAFQQTTIEQKTEFAHNLGIDFGENLYESASIGGFDPGTSPLEMSAAYAAFGRGGYYIEPYSFTKIVYLENEEEYNYKYTKTRVMSEETAYMITDMLVEGGASGVGGNIKVSGTDVAAKGGTTTIDEAEAKRLKISVNATPAHWNNVYTPDYSISLWIGFDDLRQGYLTSNTGGGPRRQIMAAVANKILKKNSRFSKPSGVVSETYEFGTYPLQLASEYTPSDLRKKALFKAGTQPTTVSTRFSKLQAPTNGNSLVNGASITLSWNPIATPDAIDKNKLQNYFNENYKVAAEKYYDERISYNRKHIGDVGYQIYLQNEDGSLISLGYTDKTTYTYEASSASNYKFIIKSAYSIFKDNMSDGLLIQANLNNVPTPDPILPPDISIPDGTNPSTPDTNTGTTN